MFTIALYVITIILLIISFYKNKEKTKKALLKGLKAFENILPQFLAIVLIIGMCLTALDQDTISKFMGSSTGLWGIMIALVIGSITLIPGFVAFPLAAALLANGAGLTQITTFVSSLMMVGIVTIPLEIKTFGKKAAIIRNVSAATFSVLVALVMGVIL